MEGWTERVMKRQEIILRVLNGELNWIQASEILGVTARQMRRLKRSYEEGGFPLLMDNRQGKKAWNRVPLESTKQILDLYREDYFDYNVTHFHEKLSLEHGITRSYSWVKKVLQESGLVAKEGKKGKHRKRRERKPLIGMMLHLDGSKHRWFGENRDPFDLLVILDDATSEIYSGDFVPEENTNSVLSIVRSVVDNRGIFCSLYTDRASHFVYTPKAGGPPDKSIRTQCQRALDQLEIKLILAMSPQARGRGERLWRTIQGRLPQELRRAGITEMDKANRFLKDIFIPDMNRLFKIEAKEKGSAFTEVWPGYDLDKIFSKQSGRQVRNDNTVSYKNIVLQIPESSVRPHFVRCDITVYEHLDDTLSIGYGPKTIGHYSPQGELLKEEKIGRGWLRSDLPGLEEGARGVRPSGPSQPDEPTSLPLTSMQRPVRLKHVVGNHLEVNRGVGKFYTPDI